MSKNVKVVQPETGPVVPTEILATAIIEIAAGVKKLRAGRLNERALLLLIQNNCSSVGGRYHTQRPGMAEVRAVLDAIEGLEAAYIRKPIKATS